MAEENININGTEDNGTENNTAPEVVFTDEQKALIAQMIQSESDRRTNQALAKQKKQYEQKLSLANLDGAEREKQENLNKIAELQEQLAQFQVEKNKSELKSVLASRGLSAEFADIITIGEDLTEAQTNIDKLDKLFKAAVKAEVEKRLAGSAPKGNGASAGEAITKESAKKMSLSELNELLATNPELYNKIFN
jgi:hypothetical protein